MEKYEHGGNPGNGILYDFSANINPLGISENVLNAIHDSAEKCCFYPDSRCEELVSRIAVHEGIPCHDIICGNGAADLIYRSVYAVMPKKALVCAPTFSEYERALEAIGCETDFYCLSEENGFQLSDDFMEQIEGHDIVFLCCPNNPVGNTVPYDILTDIIKECRRCGAVPVIDMSFIELCENASVYSTAELVSFGAVIIKAFTKLYAVPGVRLGYLMCGDQELIRRVDMAGQSWSVSVPAQAAGIAALDDREYAEKSIVYISRERRYLTEYLTEMGIKVYPSETNFLLLRSEEPLYNILLSEKILIRSCENFRGLGSSYFRIAVRTHEENVKLIYALRRRLSDGKGDNDTGDDVKRWQELFGGGIVQDIP